MATSFKIFRCRDYLPVVAKYIFRSLSFNLPYKNQEDRQGDCQNLEVSLQIGPGISFRIYFSFA